MTPQKILSEVRCQIQYQYQIKLEMSISSVTCMSLRTCQLNETLICADSENLSIALYISSWVTVFTILPNIHERNVSLHSGT